MPAPPARTEISNTYPNPSNATARAGFGKLYDYVVGLLGATGNAVDARTALGAAPLDSPTFTTLARSVTEASSENSTKIATTAWAKAGFAISIGAVSYIKFPSWMGGLVIQFGTSVVTFTAGLASATFGMAFPNGKVSQLCVNGDGDALPGSIISIHASGGWSSNLSGIAFKAVNGATAALVPDGTNLRINWIAFGN